jgi:phosphoglycerate dehydrogenase-like enzyme
VISVHSPLLDSTVAMIDKSMLSLMKYGSVLINTSRGPVINHCDLIEFLESRKDVYALLDVTDPEPPLPDSPLYSMDNVVISPHIAGCMGRECRRMGALLLGEVRRYVEGRELEYNVELKKLSKN